MSAPSVYDYVYRPERSMQENVAASTRMDALRSRTAPTAPQLRYRARVDWDVEADIREFVSWLDREHA